MESTKHSVSAASRIVGVSRATIGRHIKRGTLSYEICDGNKLIDASELIRAYGDRCRFDREENRGLGSKTIRSESQEDAGLAAIKEMQEKLIGQYASQVEHLQAALDKAQEGQNRVTLLLENQTSEGAAWQTSLDAMTEKIANETERKIEEMKQSHTREIGLLKRALQAERNLPFLKKIFR